MTTLGERIKNYESCFDYKITNKIPVIIRIDGQGFSRFTKKIQCDKPFDDSFSKIMASSMFDVAPDIDGCVFGYTQSDEITFILRNDQTENTEPWFGNRIQKICSIVSSHITATFNSKIDTDLLAYFDTRVFSVPSFQEAINVILWRQNDCIKNSVASAAYYEIAKKIGKKTSRKLLHGLNQQKQKEMLNKETNINWEDYKNKFKYGAACYRQKMELNNKLSWILDENLPVFAKNQDIIKNIIFGGTNCNFQEIYGQSIVK